MSTKIAISAIAMFMLFSMSAFGASVSITQFLSAYIPNAVISSYSIHNVSLNGNTYAILSHGISMLVVNTTGVNSTHNYSILTNASNIYKIIRPYIISTYTPSAAAISALNMSMNKFAEQAAPPLNDCRMETGLNYYTCNASNACFSCQTVPICSKWLPYYGGPTGVMGLGIANFSIQYGNLVSNYSRFYKAVKYFNSNPYQNLKNMGGALANISYVSQVLPKNPLFPLPQNFTSSQLASCSSYAQPNQEPWYCVDIGMCEYTSFNSSILQSMQNTLSDMLLLPLSNSSIMQISINSSNLAKAYIVPVVVSKNTAKFENFIDSITPSYESVLGNATSLLSKVSNATLSASVYRLESTFNEINASGINQSISLANVEIESAISNTTSLYAPIYKKYSALNKSVYNNSIKSIEYQLDYKSVPTQLAMLSAEQQSISLELMRGISSTSMNAMISNESRISSGLALFSGTPFTMGAFIKGIDGGIITSILSASNAPLGSKISSAPLYASLISLIIGIIVLFVIYLFTYFRLSRKHKIKITPRVKKSWAILFLIIFVIVLVYAYATYVYAQNANKFLPFSMFKDSLNSMSNIAIFINNSANSSSEALCANSIAAELKTHAKNVSISYVSNYTCAGSVQCMSNALDAGKPVIYISGGSNAISYKGLYGNMLSAEGAVASGSSCELADLLK
ncbi:MAG: DMT family transporter [Candidatus Micrarchaeia archaeon]